MRSLPSLSLLLVAGFSLLMAVPSAQAQEDQAPTRKALTAPKLRIKHSTLDEARVRRRGPRLGVGSLRKINIVKTRPRTSLSTKLREKLRLSVEAMESSFAPRKIQRTKSGTIRQTVNRKPTQRNFGDGAHKYPIRRPPITTQR